MVCWRRGNVLNRIDCDSGTTGAPKGATLSHFNIVNNARYCAKAMALGPADKLCIPVPLYHCFGMVLGVLCAAMMLVSSVAHAQGSIAGVVKDTSGAVLPGVTVEAASPALIEKVRTATTDASGQYAIENLRPGMYTVTFTLPGFSTVKRDGIELQGSFAASVNADLRVGTLEETITVSGESPVVDVRTTQRQRVLDAETISEASWSGR